MGFTVYAKGDLVNNERLIAFYKNELWSSHIVDRAKEQKHYGTRRYRRFVSYDFPSARRYERMKAIVSDTYRKYKKKYSQLVEYGMKI